MVGGVDYLSKADDEAMYAAILAKLTEDAQRAVPAIAQALRSLEDADVAPTLLVALERHAIDVHGPDEGRMRPILQGLRSGADARFRGI